MNKILKKLLIIIVLGVLLIAELQANVALYVEWYANKNELKGEVKELVEIYETGKFTYKYDQDSKLIEKSFKSGDSNFIFKFNYNDLGKLVSIIYEVNGEVVGEQYANYFENGKISDFLIKNIDDKNSQEFHSSIVLFDEQDNLKLVVFQLEDKSKLELKFKFNELNLLTEMGYYKNNKLMSLARYGYNKEGFVEQALRINENFQSVGVLDNKYEFDKKGNWIKKSSTFGQESEMAVKKTDVVERKIYYFSNNWFKKLFN